MSAFAVDVTIWLIVVGLMLGVSAALYFLGRASGRAPKKDSL
jgi:hypothetical protein